MAEEQQDSMDMAEYEGREEPRERSEERSVEDAEAAELAPKLEKDNRTAEYVDLHVSNLHPKTMTQDLSDDVRKIVEPVDVRVPVDPMSRLNRGFGFVTLRNEEDAHKVREKLKYVDGKLINIKSAKPNGRFGKTDRNDNNSNNIIITTTNNNGDTMNVQNEGNESETERPVERVVVRDEDESKMDDAGSGDEGDGNGLHVLHISKLNPETNTGSLEYAVRKIAEPKEVRVLVDLETQRGRGFGFAYFTKLEDAEKVLNELKVVDGATIAIQKAKRKREREKTPGVFLGKKLSGPQSSPARASYAPYHARAPSEPFRAPPRYPEPHQRGPYNPPPDEYHPPPPGRYPPRNPYGDPYAPPPPRRGDYPPHYAPQHSPPGGYDNRDFGGRYNRDSYVPAPPRYGPGPGAPRSRSPPRFSYADDPVPPPRAPVSRHSGHSQHDHYAPPPPDHDTYIPAYLPGDIDAYPQRGSRRDNGDRRQQDSYVPSSSSFRDSRSGYDQASSSMRGDRNDRSDRSDRHSDRHGDRDRDRHGDRDRDRHGDRDHDRRH